LGIEAIDRAVDTIRRLEASTAIPGVDLSGARFSDMERFVAASEGAEAEECLMSMARYFAVIGENAIATRLLAYILPVGVLPAMADRLSSIEGEQTRDAVLEG